MIIAVDFDDTIVKSAFPAIGAEVPYAIDTLKYINSLGHKIILHTCRTNKEIDGHFPLKEAAEWLKLKGVDVWAVNDNPIDREKYCEQSKVSADLYIDDRGFGTPFKDGYVDWKAIKRYFRLLALRENVNPIKGWENDK